jgi:hypothetical protein
MTYTVTITQPTGLQPDETSVTLDTGESVAVCAQVDRNHGNTVAIISNARQIDATGATISDANGHQVTSSASHQFQPEIVAQYTLPALTKEMLRLVMGELPALFVDPVTLPTSTSPPTLTALDAGVLDAWSIRNAIASAAHAGPVTNVGSLL